MLLFEKNGIRFGASCRYQADAFRGSGWKEIAVSATGSPAAECLLEGKSAAELKAYAAENGIIVGRARSAERLTSIIKAALE